MTTSLTPSCSRSRPGAPREGHETPVTANPLPFRPLGSTYKKNTFHYELVTRDGDLAIFKQQLRPGVGCLAFEVIRIRVAPALTIMGKDVPEREIAPSNEDFGSYGWSYPTLAKAKGKYHELLEQRDGG